MLLIDNGSAHTSARSGKALAALARLVCACWLPLCSSELLNEIEGAWVHLKEDYFSQMLVPRRADFYDEAVALLFSPAAPGVLRRALKPHRRCHPGRKLRTVA